MMSVTPYDGKTEETKTIRKTNVDHEVSAQ